MFWLRKTQTLIFHRKIAPDAVATLLAAIAAVVKTEETEKMVRTVKMD
jgi:hypothetical protein